MAPNTITDAQGNTLKYRANTNKTPHYDIDTNKIMMRPQSQISISGLNRFHEIRQNGEDG